MRDKFTLSGGQSAKLEIAIDRTEGNTTDVEWLCTGSNFKSVCLLARGEAKLVLKGKPVVVAVAIDPIVWVDRSVRPRYPDFLNQEYVNKPEFIALEKQGPPKFDASRLRKWRHEEQENGVVIGDVLFTSLKGEQMLPSCLGFADLLGIQAKGIEFFREHFKDMAVFGWRSVVPGRSGGLCVPCLVEDGGEAVLHWHWLDGVWGAADPALRFAP